MDELNLILSKSTESFFEYNKYSELKHFNSLNTFYAVSFCRQLNSLCWRTCLAILRNPIASIVQTFIYLFFAISMGAVYFQMNNSLESGIQNRMGLFFFCTLQVIFVNLGTIELFIKERALFM